MNLYSSNEKIANFYSFLNKYKIEKNSYEFKMTHYSMGDVKGTYSVPEDKIDEFYKLYKKIIRFTIPSILEVHLEQGPIIIDLDFKYKKDDDSRIYSVEDIKYIIKIYNQIILTYLDVTDNNILAYILEKDKPKIKANNDLNKEYEYKDGVHIIYPYICTNVKLQYFFREIIIGKLKSENYFSNLLNNLEEIFDKAIIERNGWLLYGSCKENNKDYLYKLTHIFNYNLEDIIHNLDTEDLLELPATLSIRKFKNMNNCTPYLLNINNDIIEDKLKSLQNVKGSNRKYISNNDLRKSRILLGMLSDQRSKNYDDWIDVGFCLHNIDNDLLYDWIEFSKKSSSFKEGECEKLWNSFKFEGLGIGSLYRWAKEDNINEYVNFLFDELEDLLKKSLDTTSYNIAKVFYEFNKYNYICVDIKKNKWYEFKNHRWKYMESATTIINCLNTELVENYYKLAYAYHTKAFNTNIDDLEKKKLREKGELAFKIAKKLNIMSFKKEIIAELVHLYYNPSFLNNLDENHYLLGFKNGIYDLKNNCFRNGRPEDNLSMSANANYIEFDENNPKIKEVFHFFDQIQPEISLREYLLLKLASCLEGNQRDQKFEIWIGTGANGKGRILKLLIDSFGDYACTIPITLLTRRLGDAEQASPALAKTKGKRCCIFQEPENDDGIYVGRMKNLTGGDKIMARSLYAEPIEFYPQFKTILACNKLPTINSVDGGTWRRIRVLPFEIKFVDNPVEIYERKIIKCLDDLMDEWHDAFISILIHYYKKYIKHGIFEPEKVLIYTNMYQENSDIYAEFINDKLIFTDCGSDKLSVNDMLIDFKNWAKEFNGLDLKKLKKGDFQYEMELRLGKIKNNNFIKYRYKTIMDNEII